MNILITIEIINGKELKQKDLDLINKYRNLRLGRTRDWDHSSNNYFHDRTLFLVKDNDELVSFGTLRPIKIYIDSSEITIMGIQAVISIVQGKGYGKILIKEMIRYANDHSLTLVGFCENYNAEFYIKSGLEVFKNKNPQFIYIKENGERYTEEGDVIYYSKTNNLVKSALLNNEEITHFVPHW